MPDTFTAEELIKRWNLSCKPLLLQMAAELGALPSSKDAYGNVVFAFADLAIYESPEGQAEFHSLLRRAQRAHGKLRRARDVHDRRVQVADEIRSEKRRHGWFAGRKLRRALVEAERQEAEAARAVHHIVAKHT